MPLDAAAIPPLLPPGVAARSAPVPRPALPDGRPLGAHLPLADGMVRAVERAHAIGADTVQVFADNPSSWKRRAEPPIELAAFRARAAELGIGHIAIHASYLVNLAGPDDVQRERSIELLAHELAVAPGYGARFVNVHVGSHKGSGVEAGIARVAGGVARALGATPGHPGAPMLVLENSAGSGDGLGTTVEELERILEAAAARGVATERLAVCLDTAHLWGAGQDVATAEGVDALLEEFARRIGLARLVMVHLNDSKVARGSRLDRHEHLGAGRMGGGEGLARLMTHPALSHVAYYLETPGMDEGYDAVNMARARDLARGVPLAPLPAGRSRSAGPGHAPRPPRDPRPGRADGCAAADARRARARPRRPPGPARPGSRPAPAGPRDPRALGGRPGRADAGDPGHRRRPTHAARTADVDRRDPPWTRLLLPGRLLRAAVGW